MNLHALLGNNGYTVYEGELGMIDYGIIETGRKLQRMSGGKTLELCIIPDSGEVDQIFIYTFYDDGFSVKRWVKKPEPTP